MTSMHPIHSCTGFRGDSKSDTNPVQENHQEAPLSPLIAPAPLEPHPNIPAPLEPLPNVPVTPPANPLPLDSNSSPEPLQPSQLLFVVLGTK